MTSVVEETASGSAGAGVGQVAGEGGLSAQELLAQVLDDKTMAALAARARESGLALLGEGGSGPGLRLNRSARLLTARRPTAPRARSERDRPGGCAA